MTEVIIKEMSQVTIDNDMLEQVDMNGLLKEFKNNYDKLDEFKETRDAYENRGFLARLNPFDDTMKNAQLNATEVQAKFSKSLGQLMVINVAQSQYLQKQQEQLAIQQGVIKNQTEQIEIQTHEIEKQHEVLAKQNSDLEKLVNDYFELRGLTQDGAKKLIAIANEIQHTRDNLLESMEKSHTWVEEQQEKTLQEISLQMASSNESTQKDIEKITKRCNAIESNNSQLTQQLSEIKISFLEKSEAMDTVLSAEFKRFDTHIINTENNFSDLISNFDGMKEEFKLYRENQNKATKKLLAVFSIFILFLSASVAYSFFR